MHHPAFQRFVPLALLLVAATAGFSVSQGQTTFPVVETTHVPIRILSANLTDNDQTYEDYALRIFQGLKPDVIAIQEFNYLGNSPAELRAMVNVAFGTNFSYYREPGYSIPNGIISRWPIASAGSWVDDDAGVNDRGFAWARLDVPGSNDLHVVSVHLKASSGASNEQRRSNQVAQIKRLVQSSFPGNAWVVVAGDCNFFSDTEPGLSLFKTFLRDEPVPSDAPSGGDADTNNGRSERYDYVFPSLGLDTHRVATIVGTLTFPNGLVFDSRVYPRLVEVAPVQQPDSGLAQHMAVMKDFRIQVAITNFVEVPPPTVTLLATNILHWTGPSLLSYTVEGSVELGEWTAIGPATSATTNYWFTNSVTPTNQFFYRVTFP